jgi:hypothetical protein
MMKLHMYNRLNKIINKIKSLGSTRWGRREVVDKILSAYMARDVQLPTLIRQKRGFNKFTPADVIGRMCRAYSRVLMQGRKKMDSY